jgi:hypothetical protein
MSKKPKPAKPVVSAIPTWQEMKTVFGHVDGYDNGFKAIHALVASQVVEDPKRYLEITSNAEGVVAQADPTHLDPIRLDPIKAIVEILDIMIDVAAFDENRGRVYDKLAALKRSLEPQ